MAIFSKNKKKKDNRASVSKAGGPSPDTATPDQSPVSSRKVSQASLANGAHWVDDARMTPNRSASGQSQANANHINNGNQSQINSQVNNANPSQVDQTQGLGQGLGQPLQAAPMPGPLAQARIPSGHSQQNQPPVYPWSQISISNASPFPRYGHSANPIVARDGEVFIMGGLKGSNVFGDMWVIETETLSGYLLDTEGCPSPRVGHASLTLGNAFILFGGDTKIDETDVLDDNLYLLNTTTLKWTVASPTGPRPSGRYGHSISTLGSTVYVFGGQLDDEFFDDLVAYDLTTLRSPESRWTVVQPTSGSPPRRTNHTMVTYNDKLYLFGGTDGNLWYSDTWCYDPVPNTWTLLECSGFIPSPCEGHAATVVDDIMYVFGGRSSKGVDIGTLSALKLTTRKWYAFQNLGPGPSPRSGHSMTAFGDRKVIVMGGESPEMMDADDGYVDDKTRTVYVLDTARINYPPDAQAGNVAPMANMPPALSANMPPPISAAPAGQKQVPVPAGLNGRGNSFDMAEKAETHDLNNGPEPISKDVLSKDVSQVVTEDLTKGLTKNLPKDLPKELPKELPKDLPKELSKDLPKELSKDVLPNDILSKDGLPKAPISDALSGADASATISKDATISSSHDRNVSVASVTPGVGYERVDVGDTIAETPYHEPTIPGAWREKHIPEDELDEVNGLAEPNHSLALPKPRVRDEPVSSVKQAMERLKASNSWYETELAAAKDAGYVPSSRPPVDVLKLRRVSQVLTQDTQDSLQERDILIAALNELKHELQLVQDNVKAEAAAASQRISEVESERNRALKENEALQASHGNTAGLQSRIAELEAELAESSRVKTLVNGDSRDISEGGATDQIRAENISLEKQLREKTDKLILAQHDVTQLRSQLEALTDRHQALEASADDKVRALTATGAALTASEAKYAQVYQQLDQHRTARATAEQQLAEAQQEAARHRQLAESHQQDAQHHKALLDQAHEQLAHSHAALSEGIDKVAGTWAASKSFQPRGLSGEDEGAGSEVLQKQVADVTELYESHKQAADRASDQLSEALQQLAALKQQLAATDQSKTSAAAQLRQAHGQIAALEAQLADRASVDRTAELEQRVRQMEQNHEVVTKELNEMHTAKYSELESEYTKSLQYFNNTEAALAKTRDELARHKDMNGKLQTKVDELRLRVNDDDEAGGDVDDSFHSLDRVGSPQSKYNSRHLDLQLRDLKAQVIILEEERNELRASVLDLKKKQINWQADLDDAHAEVRRLAEENSTLRAT